MKSPWPMAEPTRTCMANLDLGVCVQQIREGGEREQ